MTQPMIGALEDTQDGQCNVSLVASPPSLESVSNKSCGLKERNYLKLSDCSSVDSSAISSFSEQRKSSLNLRATELTLGLPGSQSPKRDSEPCLLGVGKFNEKYLFPLLPSNDCIYPSSQKTVITGNKRGFSDAVDGLSEEKSTVFSDGNWMFPAAGSDSETAQSTAQGKFPVNSRMNTMMLSRSSLNLRVKPVAVKDHSDIEPAILKDIVPLKVLKDMPHDVNETSQSQIAPTNNTSNPPAAKAQVVGWPPIRSFRKNTLATTTKNEEVDGKPGPCVIFVKVSMDGAPYLRKVDLRTYYGYQELSSSLENMFSCFTIGQCGPHGAPRREMLSESKLRDLLHGSEYVLTYEDKDGDWMLVGDVPWEMFIDSCMRLRIMKSSDAIGLAPRAGEKCRNKN